MNITPKWKYAAGLLLAAATLLSTRTAAIMRIEMTNKFSLDLSIGDHKIE